MSDVEPAYAVAVLVMAIAPAVMVLLIGAAIEYALLTSIFVMVTTQLLQDN